MTTPEETPTIKRYIRLFYYRKEALDYRDELGKVPAYGIFKPEARPAQTGKGWIVSYDAYAPYQPGDTEVKLPTDAEIDAAHAKGEIRVQAEYQRTAVREGLERVNRLLLDQVREIEGLLIGEEEAYKDNPSAVERFSFIGFGERVVNMVNSLAQLQGQFNLGYLARDGTRLSLLQTELGVKVLQMPVAR